VTEGIISVNYSKFIREFSVILGTFSISRTHPVFRELGWSHQWLTIQKISWYPSTTFSIILLSHTTHKYRL